ncbi:hypothetical protein [Spirosoma pollinicola]|uniref:Uncharacterized protein n=1 Tax=Spirosoma pollinicola TaxID=2057025 RepID=A0A2K8YUI3_9BACT|nr:hypothetical protein [Spirosoma pollinicola]AUD01287.1 hypothetical protein CWM47_05365 [Spirosoma pollinicola]
MGYLGVVSVPIWFTSFGFVAVGIFLLIRGIKQILTFVGGPVLLKLPFTRKSGQFVVPDTGEYSIWQSGKTLQRAPVKISVPGVFALPTGEPVTVRPTFSRVRVNNGWEGRIQLFTFRAKAGQYELELTDHPSTYFSESPRFLEVRERKLGYQLVFGILILLFAAACLIMGLVLPFINRN